MRLFFAAFLSPENRTVYQDLVEKLIQEVPGALRSVPRDTHHLTLVFLGEVPQEHVAGCIELLTCCEEIDAFPIRLGRPRILIGRGRPRLICTDVEAGRQGVSEVQVRLATRLSRLLPALDLRPKPLHVTLARFHKRARRSEAHLVQDALLRSSDDAAARTDHFAAVQLVSSTLTPSGPSYETVAEVRLADER